MSDRITSTEQRQNRRLFFGLILVICVFTRFFWLGVIPLGLNQDEAFSAFEALSLLKSGTDSWGYRYPMYFVSWGSGMNTLYAYLLSGFFLVFGINDWVVRLPQAVAGVLSCYVFYRLMSFLYGKKVGLVGFFVVTIMPWHIMLSRFGLESNIAPAFMLLGFYFFLKGVKKGKYLPLSGLFYGMALYGYAVCWVFIGAVVAINNGYLVWLNVKCRLEKGLYILAELFVFGLCAVPAFLFLLVNFGVIDEIKTAFFSVPKMVYWRSGEVGCADLAVKLGALWRVVVYGDDFLVTNAIKPFGVFYPISLIFVAIGAGLLVKKAKEDVCAGVFSYNFLILIHLFSGLVYAAMLYPCINRLNFLWFYFLIIIVLGISFFRGWMSWGILTVYAVCFFIFMHTYFTKYNRLAGEWFSPGFKEALDEARRHQAKWGNRIYIEEMPFSYPKVLFYGKTDALEFQKTVVWDTFPNAYLDVVAFSFYRFENKTDYQNVSLENIYIVPKERAYYFWNFDVYRFGRFAVAVPKEGK